MEEADDSDSRGTRRAKIGRGLVALALVLLLVALGMFAYYFTLPQYTDPPCWGFQVHLGATLNATPAPNGYVFSLTSTSHVKPLDCYAVSVSKDGAFFWYSHPPSSAGPITHKTVVDGLIGTGPAGEYLRFTDSDGNGKLNAGDFFTLERLEPNTEYELVLVTDRSELITRERVVTP